MSVCAACTYLNESAASVCEMCSEPLRAPSAVKATAVLGVRSAHDLNAADVETVVSMCGISDVKARVLLLTVNGAVDRAINLHFDQAAGAGGGGGGGGHDAQSASDPVFTQSSDKPASQPASQPASVQPTAVSWLQRSVSLSSKPKIEASAKASTPAKASTSAVASVVRKSFEPTPVKALATVVSPPPVVTVKTTAPVRSIANSSIPDTNGDSRPMSVPPQSAAMTAAERKRRERVQQYNTALWLFSTRRTHFVGTLSCSYSTARRNPKKKRDALWMILRLMAHNAAVRNVRVDGRAVDAGFGMYGMFLPSRHLCYEMRCALTAGEQSEFAFEIDVWLALPKSEGEVKVNERVLTLLRQFKKLEPLKSVLPTGFAASRALPENSGNNGSGDAGHVSIADWYKFFTSDVDLQTLTRADVERLKLAMPQITLREYQKQAVQWMMSRELGAASINDIMWQRALLPVGSAAGPLGAVFAHKYRPSMLTSPPPLATGGILAEEMGLGKTIEVLSLIALNRATSAQLSEPTPPRPKLAVARTSRAGAGALMATRATLIITPVTLLGQWKTELQSRFANSNRSMDIYVYHTNRKRDRAFLVKHDVVLTSYSIVRAEVRRSDSPLHDIYWHRIVLDESHSLKTLGKNLLLGELCHLPSRHRWCVSGTPITTLHTDIVQQAQFLGLPIHSSTTARHLDMNSRAYADVLRALVMAHRASQRDLNGDPLVALPARHAHVIEVELDPHERQLYDYVHRCCKEDMQLLAEGGERLVARFYTRIVSSVLLPPRMVLAHPSTLTEHMLASFGVMNGAPPSADALARLPRFVPPAANDDDDDEPPAAAAAVAAVTASSSAAAKATPAKGRKRAAALAAVGVLSSVSKPADDDDADADEDADVDDKVASTSTRRKVSATPSSAPRKRRAITLDNDDDDEFDVCLDGDDDDDDVPSGGGDDDDDDDGGFGKTPKRRRQLAQSAPASIARPNQGDDDDDDNFDAELQEDLLRVPPPPKAEPVVALPPRPPSPPVSQAAPQLNEQQKKWLSLLLEQPECAVCLEVIADATVTDCNHIFCYECVMALLNSSSRKCPLCRRVIKETDIHHIQSHVLAAAAAGADGGAGGGGGGGGGGGEGGGPNNVRNSEAQQRALALAIAAAETLAAAASANAPGSKVSVSVRQQHRERAAAAVEALRNMLSRARPGSRELSELMALLRAHAESSKIRALLSLIHKIRAQDAQAKVVVFSQWSSVIVLVSKLLTTIGVGNVQITGDMPMTKRSKNLERFQFDDETPVFLLSLRSGSVGVTLTAANHLVMMEPVLNKATEEQALNRIYRIGQTRETHVWQMYTKNSIEEAIHKRSVVLDRGIITDNANNAANNNAGAAASVAAESSSALIGRVDSTWANDDTSRSVSIGEVANLFGVRFADAP